MNSGKNAIDYAVLNPDELQLDIRSYLVLLTRGHGHDRVFYPEDPLRFYLLIDQVRREWSGYNRRFVFVRQLGDRTYVVQVAVSTGNCPYFAINVAHDAVIGDGPHGDQVGSVKGLHIRVLVNLDPIQTDAHVHNHYVISYLDRGHVPSDLVVSADRNNSNILHLAISL
ncbi:Uncharacterised protein [uncultured archaeon]|nr:Uncharacterised protein [uncultured archaeon]